MVVERNQKLESESGQSLLEFLFLFPAMLALTVILIRVNTVIQAGIVNQQYARSQTLFLAFNSPYFPEIGKRIAFRSDPKAGYWNHQITLGVSGNLMQDEDGSGGRPVDAFVYPIIRNARRAQDAPAQSEDEVEISKVRVRTTVSMCVPSTYVLNGNDKVAMSQLKGELASATAFNYCGGKLDE